MRMRKCGVTKNVVFGYSRRYTVYYTENSNHLNQNIWHKRSMLVNDNTAEYNVSQEKKKHHETMHDGAIGTKSRLVGFIKQAKNRVSD